MKRVRIPTTAALLLASLLGLPQWAQAQGSLDRIILDPAIEIRREGTYGGEAPAAELGEGCVGYVDRDPNFILEIEQDSWVRISVDAPEGQDTTLMVRGSEGAVCNDDGDSDTLDPRVVTFLPQGEYFVHVGAFTAGETGSFSIRFAESSGEDFTEINGSRAVRLGGTSGGTLDAASRGHGCLGAIPSRPDHIVRLSQNLFLRLDVRSASDLTLVVVTDEGTYCNDDALGTLDPQVSAWFSEGLVRIYVGSHNHGVEAPYDLTITPTTRD